MVTSWQCAFLAGFVAGLTLSILGAARLRALARGGGELLSRLAGLVRDGKPAEALRAALEEWPSAVGESFAAALCGEGPAALSASRGQARRALAVSLAGALLPVAAFLAGIHPRVPEGASEAPADPSLPSALPRLVEEFVSGEIVLPFLLALPLLVLALAVRRSWQIRGLLHRIEFETPASLCAAARPDAPAPARPAGPLAFAILGVALASAGAIAVWTWRSHGGLLFERGDDLAAAGFGLLALAAIAFGLAAIGSPTRGLDRRVVVNRGWLLHGILLLCGPHICLLPLLGAGLFEKSMVLALLPGIGYLALLLTLSSKHLLVDPVGRRVLRWRGPLGLRARATCASANAKVVIESVRHETKNLKTHQPQRWTEFTVVLYGDQPFNVCEEPTREKAQARATAVAELLRLPFVPEDAPAPEPGRQD